jgi:hypothetical protein
VRWVGFAAEAYVIDFVGGFEFQGLYVYPATGEGATFYYLPLAPSPEMDSKGRPTLMAMPLGKGGFVQLGTHLEAREQTLQALRAELAARLKLADAGQVSLSMAPLKVTGADMEVGDGAGKFGGLAHSDTSGFPPYAAVFHAQTDAAQQAAVSAALNGRTGFLQVSYAAGLSLPIHAEAHLQGDVHGLLTSLSRAQADLPALARSLLDEALGQGKLKLEVQASDHASEDLARRAAEQAKARFVELLLQVQRGDAHLPDQATAQAGATLDEFVDLPLTLVTDVATWFGGQGADHIILPPQSTG